MQVFKTGFFARYSYKTESEQKNQALSPHAAALVGLQAPPPTPLLDGAPYGGDADDGACDEAPYGADADDGVCVVGVSRAAQEEEEAEKEKDEEEDEEKDGGEIKQPPPVGGEILNK